VGVTGAVVGVAAVALRGRCPTTWFLLGLVALGLFFALGGYNPLWYLAYKVLPGFKLFRVPARWLYVSTFGAAGLVAIGLDALRSIRRPVSQPEPTRVPPLVLCAVGVLAVACDLTFVGSFPAWLGAPLTWVVIAVVTIGLILVARRSAHPFAARALLLGVLVGELFAAGRALDFNHPLPTELYTDLRQTEAFLQSDQDVFRTLSIAQDNFDSGDKADLEHLFGPDLGHASVENLLVGTKWKEVLSPNVGLTYHLETLDGYDGGVLPLSRYAGFKRLYVPPCKGCENPDAILRNELIAIPDLAWLSLLNVKYIIADKVHDVWVNNVYYDLTNAVTLAPSEPPLRLRGFVPTGATSVGLVTSLSGARDLRNGAVVAHITVRSADGSLAEFDLRAGVDTSEAEWTTETSHAKANAISAWNGNERAFNYLAVLTLPALRWVDEIDVTNVASAGSLNVRGAALVDTATGTSTTLTIANDAALTTVESGDVKIYRNERVLPRAFLVPSASIVPDDNAALSALAALHPHFERQAILTYPPGETHHSLPFRVLNGVADALNRGSAPALPPLPTAIAEQASLGPPGTAIITSNAPERVEVRATANHGGYLVLSDEWYPGWSAVVDGRPTTLYRTDGLLMSAQVSPGTHDVVFQYRSRYLRLGLVVTSLAGTCALGLPYLANLLRRVQRGRSAQRRAFARR
jgi:hypothetical protein